MAIQQYPFTHTIRTVQQLFQMNAILLSGQRS